MGLYVEPQTGTKIQFIRDGVSDGLIEVVTLGQLVEMSRPTAIFLDQGKVILCLVDNGFFQALAVAFNDSELGVFMDFGDTRPKTFFVADKQLVKNNTTNFDSYFRS
jgi:hypothetical protein